MQYLKNTYSDSENKIYKHCVYFNAGNAFGYFDVFNHQKEAFTLNTFKEYITKTTYSAYSTSGKYTSYFFPVSVQTDFFNAAVVQGFQMIYYDSDSSITQVKLYALTNGNISGKLESDKTRETVASIKDKVIEN